MKPTNIAIITFIHGTVVDSPAIAVGYISYADSANYFDREGATGMAVVFFYAPVGGILVGIISAVATFKILKRRTP